ncbi:hypothetical protein JW935_07930 [candidate division KSB1 bacterium]|nr:hypothetical protein [candidate division KSB1 bacterium]
MIRLLLLLFFFPGLPQAKDQNTYIHREKNSVTVFFIPHDSIYANQASELIRQKWDEITWDIQAKAVKKPAVVITASRREYIQFIKTNKLPRWAAAVANPRQNIIYVKSPSWDQQNTSFRYNVIHEMIHILLNQIVAPYPIPRWLDEGMALYYSEEKRWSTNTSISKAVLTNSLLPLDDIDHVLEFHQIKAELAYHQSYSVVKYLISAYTEKSLQIIIEGLAQNKPRDEIFLEATGLTFADFEKQWRIYAREQNRWLWISEIQNYIWIFILLLLILAFILVHHRNKRIIQEWEIPPIEE